MIEDKAEKYFKYFKSKHGDDFNLMNISIPELMSDFYKERVKAITNKLEECFEPSKVTCDGICCMGCWKDIVRNVIKELKK